MFTSQYIYYDLSSGTLLTGRLCCLAWLESHNLPGRDTRWMGSRPLEGPEPGNIRRRTLDTRHLCPRDQLLFFLIDYERPQ